ncbi:RHS repeat-associated core domain-containing protein [Pseudomonas chlororaphis]|uniref:RHS repeat-associated core domain-containing protein n=1 Tax=Pseudomonas chlororaphis TaxID=587753 RepID=UPI001C60C20D|nr:RHS repeat-associated core domain-containing protein [Pseudomonas chlororaphis]
MQYNRTEMEGPLEELITQQTYSVLGHPSSSIDPRLLAEQQLDASVQPNFRYQHSLSGRPLKTHSQDAGALLVVYDCEGGPVWQRNSRDQQQRRTYDSLHRPTTYYEQAANDPEQVSERWFYGEELPAPAANCRRQLLRHYSPAGLTITPSYSVTGQLLTSEQQFLRDEVLNSDWSGDDPARWNDDLTVQIYTSHWGFNALGIQVHSADAKGNQQRQRLNIAGQLAGSELQLFGHTTAHAVLRTIDYSAAGQVLHEEAGNGVVTDYGYEPQTQRLAALTTSRPELTGRPRLLQALTYQYDPVGNLLSISDGAEPTRYSHNQRVEAASQYSYDALYQLRQASGRENANATQQAQALPPAIVPLWQETGELTHYSRTYTYDRGSNLTTIRHVGLHPYTQQMVVAPTSNRAVQQTLGVTPGDVDSFFDACGNLRELNAGQPLAWNSRNQLQRSTQVVRSGLDDDAEQYWYDGQGQRSCKLATTRTSGTTHTARVYYLPGLELRQTRVQPHVGEPSVSEALQVINAGAAGRQSLRVLHWEQGKPAAIENDQCRYSLDDQIGSSLIELDQRADILTWEEYFPFGGTAVWSARNETETRYKYVRYSGKERDGTGLYYYGFRYYAPWLGRWLNPDPAGTVDGLNLFCMVGNNPITRKDPAGLARVPYTQFGSEQRNNEYCYTNNSWHNFKHRFSQVGVGGTASNIASGVARGARRLGSSVASGVSRAVSSITSGVSRAASSITSALKALVSRKHETAPPIRVYTIPFSEQVVGTNSDKNFYIDLPRGDYWINGEKFQARGSSDPDKDREAIKSLIPNAEVRSLVESYAHQGLSAQAFVPASHMVKEVLPMTGGADHPTYIIQADNNKATIDVKMTFHEFYIRDEYGGASSERLKNVEGEVNIDFGILLRPEGKRAYGEPEATVRGTGWGNPFGDFTISINTKWAKV